ncbi:MAG: hypothetical protein WBW73_08070, partial [Rhodoplanes sp.]
VSGTVVRVDLVSLSPTERDANGSPKSVFRQRLIFSIEGFANSVGVMQQALQGLVDAGAVQRSPRLAARTPGHTVSKGVPASVAEQRPRANASPNFRQVQ